MRPDFGSNFASFIQRACIVGVRKQLPVIVAVLLALVPLFLFAYLGQFSRMMADDYRYLGKALESGTWQAMLVWREYWNGDYTNYLLYGLLAPLGVVVPSIFPSVIIATGLLGFVWLNLKVLAFVGIRRHRYLVTVALASLILVAAINGFYSEQAFYWFAATLDYTFPALTLLLCIAFAVETASRLRTKLQLSVAAISVSAIAFVNAGFSEMYMVFQLAFTGLLVVCVYMFVDRPRRRIYLILAFAGFVGSLASLPVQMSAPGVAIRSTISVHMGYKIEPMRTLPILIARTLDLTFQYLGHQRAFAGFMMLVAAGLFVTLKMFKPVPTGLRRGRSPVATSALWVGLIVQLIFIPVLWSHSSDNIEVLGRFSYSFLVVVSINMAFIVALLVLIWQRALLSEALNNKNGLLVVCSIVLLTVGLLFALPQIRSIHHKAASYLCITSAVLLGMLSWQLISVLAATGDRQAKRFGLLAVPSSVITAFTLATMIAVSLWWQGFVFERTFAPITFLLMVSGLACGASIGILIYLSCPLREAHSAWLRWASILSLLVSMTIETGIVIGQAQRKEVLATRARMWDKSHQEIIRLRDEGNPAVYTQEFYFRRVYEIGRASSNFPTGRLDWIQKLYYGLNYEPRYSE